MRCGGYGPAFWLGKRTRLGPTRSATVNFLSDLDKSEADLFTKLCGFGWMVGEIKLLVFDETAGIYNQNGVDFASLSHLDSIGLVQFEGLAGFANQHLPKRLTVAYYGRRLTLEMPKDSDNRLSLGKAILTRTGKELAPISGSKSVEGFWEYVRDRWKEYLPKPEPKGA